MECYSCLANRGERRISPGPVMYDGDYWTVDHAYPTALVGWLVLVLKRHAEAMHELSAAECAEMGELLGRTARALREETGCEKEYIACFAEADHFHHVHIHVVPRRADLPHELQGPRSFALLNPAPETAAAPEDVVAFCERMRARLARA
jgi:diadenosine tetraphosphate (Ap4A) HIT family hydrolase